VESASSPQTKSKQATRNGRHRAPSTLRRTIKIITVAAPAVALAGVFVAYQAQPQSPSRPDPVASTVASYHHQTLNTARILAEGSAQLMLPLSPSSSKSTRNTKAAPTGKSRQKVKAAPARKSGGSSKAPTPSASATPSPSNSTASLKADVQKDIADGNYLLAVAQYLVENGYSDAGAAGVAGCIAGESGGNPESVGSGGGGLIGWTPLSSAAPNSNIITGNVSQDMMAQLADLLYYNSTEIGQSYVTQLNAITDPVSAADFYSANFEKPAVLYSDVRPSEAEEIYSDLQSS
jgi:Phage tail lysozyme